MIKFSITLIIFCFLRQQISPASTTTEETTETRTFTPETAEIPKKSPSTTLTTSTGAELEHTTSSLPEGVKEVFDTIERVAEECWNETDKDGVQLTREVLVCDTAAVDIKCCLGSRIEIQYAKYGRTPKIDICGKTPEKSCPASTSSTLETLQYLCRNQFKCTINPRLLFNNTDPCPGVPKYLIIKYVCSSYTPGRVVPVSYQHQESVVQLSSKKHNKTMVIAQAANDIVGIGVKNGTFESTPARVEVADETERSTSTEIKTSVTTETPTTTLLTETLLTHSLATTEKEEIELPIEWENTTTTTKNGKTAGDEEPSLVEDLHEKTTETTEAVDKHDAGAIGKHFSSALLIMVALTVCLGLWYNPNSSL